MAYCSPINKIETCHFLLGKSNTAAVGEPTAIIINKVYRLSGSIVNTAHGIAVMMVLAARRLRTAHSRYAQGLYLACVIAANRSPY